MKKTLLCLIVATLALASPARADDAVLQYALTSETAITTIVPASPGKRQSTDTQRTNRNTTLTVTFLADKFSVKDGDAESVYDMPNRTLYKIDHAKKTYQIVPLYSIPVEHKKLREEMGKRAVDFETLSGLGRWVKTNAGHVLDTKEHDVDLDSLYASVSNMTSAGGLTLVHRGKEKSFESPTRGDVLKFTFSDKLLPQSLLKSYNSFLVYVPSLHPDVEKAMGAGSKPFATLNHKANDHCGRVVTEQWELKDIQINKKAELVAKPAGYAPVFTTTDPLANEAFVISQKPGPTAADYGARIKGYVAAGDGMRAMLAMNEMMFSLPAEQTVTQDNLTFGVLGLTDEDLVKKTMLAVTQKQTTQNGVNMTNDYLKQAKKLYKDYVYFLDVFRARNIRTQVALDLAAGKPFNEKEFSKAFKMYANALSANPWMAIAYGDLGDTHYDHGDNAFAWICWEQALRLKPDSPIKAKVEKLKQSAEKEFPEYF